jgi:transcriptional regulator with XRE-family HTH domain
LAKWKSIPEASSLDLTSEQIRAARALLRWDQADLAEASGVSLPTIKRLETKPGYLGGYASTLAAILTTLESAGIEFIPENGGGPGVRLKRKSRTSTR